MVAAIDIKDVRKTFSKTPALKGITLRIEAGSFFGLLGPNGAGKTTLIRCITGLTSLGSGTISILGKDNVIEYKHARSSIGLSQQDIHMDPHFPILEILTYQAGYFGVRRRDALQRAEKLLKQFHVWEKRNNTYRELSGGMKRKVEIAKALIHNPKILILDEPTAGLDVQTRQELWATIRELNKEGLTILLTTHYIEEAQEMCSRIAIINKGEIVTEKPTKELMESFSTKQLVATYRNRPKKILGSTLQNKQLTVPVQQDDEAKILKKLLAAGDLIKIHTKEQTLEEVFLRLTEEAT